MIYGKALWVLVFCCVFKLCFEGNFLRVSTAASYLSLSIFISDDVAAVVVIVVTNSRRARFRLDELAGTRSQIDEIDQEIGVWMDDLKPGVARATPPVQWHYRCTCRWRMEGSVHLSNKSNSQLCAIGGLHEHHLCRVNRTGKCCYCCCCWGCWGWGRGRLSPNAIWRRSDCDMARRCWERPLWRPLSVSCVTGDIKLNWCMVHE